MSESAPSSKGLLQSLTHLTGTLIGVVQTRLSLLATDVEQGNQQLMAMLALALTAASSATGPARMMAS